MLHRIHLLRFKGGRIVGWVLSGLLVAVLGATASDVYLAAERQRSQAEVNFYNDAANLTPALKKYREVIHKLKDYQAQGVPVDQATPAIGEIKEDMIAGAYAQAEAKIDALGAALDQLHAAKVEDDALAQTPPPPPPPPPSPPRAPSPPPAPPPPVVSSRCGASYYTQNVNGYSTYIIEADISSGCIKVVTDTAYGGTNCSDNCPVFSLGHYVSSNGGFGGMNGTYFCPGDYSSCAGSDGSFFWKVFNSNVRFMHNQNNGLAHLDPFVAVGANNHLYYYQYYREEVSGVCQPGSFCSVSAFEAAHGALQAGVGSGPALVANGNNVLNEGSLDNNQKAVKGNRGAYGVRGDVLYLVLATGATVIDLAGIMDSLPVDHAFNVDGGGSAAMYWEGGYKRGPGRSIPNAIVLVNK